MMDEELLFTPAAIFDMLQQIKELQNYDIQLNETPDGLILQVGDSTYHISSETADTIIVDEETLSEISEVSDSAVIDLSDNDIVDINDVDTEVIESGLLRAVTDAIAIAGLVKFAGKHIIDKIKKEWEK